MQKALGSILSTKKKKKKKENQMQGTVQLLFFLFVLINPSQTQEDREFPWRLSSIDKLCVRMCVRTGSRCFLPEAEIKTM